MIFSAACWAGLLALDITGFGPWMISQPMVCGPLFGWLTGHVVQGVVIGGIVQLLWMDVTPVGVGIPFDTMAVTLLAVFWSSLEPDAASAPYVGALLLAVPFGLFFRLMDHTARRLNTVLARRVDAVADARLSSALTVGIGLGLIWSWIRYGFFYAVSMEIGRMIWTAWGHAPMVLWLSQALRPALYLLPMAGMGVALELFLSDEPERRLKAFRSPRQKK